VISIGFKAEGICGGSSLRKLIVYIIF